MEQLAFYCETCQKTNQQSDLKIMRYDSETIKTAANYNYLITIDICEHYEYQLNQLIREFEKCFGFYFGQPYNNIAYAIFNYNYELNYGVFWIDKKTVIN
jgi:hypothetical protein